MAHLRVDFFSDVLGLGTSMTVLLPQRTTTSIGLTHGSANGEPPVLYLLHGLSDDDTAWSRYTSVERYAAERGLAVVMPQVQRSFYLDEAYGNRYWTFLSEELPNVVAGFFRVSTAREDTFVAGLSMGGYGALRWALRDPGRFGAAASLSGALDLAFRQHDRQWRRSRPGLAEQLFGERAVAGSENDLLALLAGADPRALPPLYVACGSDDPLLAENERFVAFARGRGITPHVHIGPGGHDWAYWDAQIQDVLAWLPRSTTGRRRPR